MEEKIKSMIEELNIEIKVLEAEEKGISSKLSRLIVMKLELEKIIEKYEEELDIEPGKIKIETLTMEGNAADVILKISEEKDVDLVVMASSGKHMIDRFLLGSVTEKTVRHSKVPVLVIPNGY